MRSENNFASESAAVMATRWPASDESEAFAPPFHDAVARTAEPLRASDDARSNPGSTAPAASRSSSVTLPATDDSKFTWS